MATEVVDNGVEAKVNGDIKSGHLHTNGNANKQTGGNGVVSSDTGGPDRVVPADDVMTSDSTGAVRLRMSSSGPLSAKPISVPSLLLDRVKTYPNHPALRDKRDGAWVTWTYRQYYDTVKQAAKSFIKLGLEPYHGVSIVGFNSPEWFFSDLAAIFAGGFAVGIYTTNSPEACQYVAENSSSQIIVVENEKQLEKIVSVWDKLPDLKAVVQYRGQPSVNRKDVYNWSDFMKLGDSVGDDVLDERLRGIAINKCCTLIYTSGTTGNPKGVMLSHDNITWTAREIWDMLTTFGFKTGAGEHFVSYLPLSHIAAQLCDIYLPIYGASTIYFAQPDALKGSLTETLKDVRPTAFLGVPRVWEKIEEKLQEIGRHTTGMKKKISNWAKDVGHRGNTALQRGESLPWGWSIANALVFNKIRQALGLDRCKFCATAAAPIMKETLDYFLSLNIPVLEIYGMSESTGPHTVSVPKQYRIGAVGKEFPGATTKLDKSEDGNGEICMSGRHVFMGYLNKEDKTKEAVDEEGWLHSGDVGRVEDGYLYITGRIKELLITAGGENVAPVPIEDHIKEQLPVVANAMVIGDKKKYLSVLLTLKCEADPDSGEPLDLLTPLAKDWVNDVMQGEKPHYTTVSQVRSKMDDRVLKAIQLGIDRANKLAVSRAQNIQKWTILPKDFSISGGELGPTMKVRRPIVTKMYHETIEKFYQA